MDKTNQDSKAKIRLLNMSKRAFVVVLVVLMVSVLCLSSVKAQVYSNKYVLKSQGSWYYVNDNTGELLTSIGVVYSNGIIKAKTMEDGKVKIIDTRTLYYFTDSIGGEFDYDMYKQKKNGKYLVQMHKDYNDIQFFKVKIINDTSVMLEDMKRPKKRLCLKSK